MTKAKTAQATDVVLTAATCWEASPLCADLRLRPAGQGMWSGRIGNSPVTLMRTGMGAQAAGTALSRIDGSPSLIISTGFAGALQPDLRTGDIIAEELSFCPAAIAALSRGNIHHHAGSIAHSNKVLTEPGEKLALGRSTGALAVDMESSAIRAWAQERGLAALALRVILDEAGRALPRSLPTGEDAFSLACYAALNPLSWPRLAALWPLQRRAAAALTATMRAFLEAL